MGSKSGRLAALLLERAGALVEVFVPSRSNRGIPPLFVKIRPRLRELSSFSERRSVASQSRPKGLRRKHSVFAKPDVSNDGLGGRLILSCAVPVGGRKALQGLCKLQPGCNKSCPHLWKKERQRRAGFVRDEGLRALDCRRWPCNRQSHHGRSRN